MQGKKLTLLTVVSIETKRTEAGGGCLVGEPTGGAVVARVGLAWRRGALGHVLTRLSRRPRQQDGTLTANLSSEAIRK